MQQQQDTAQCAHHPRTATARHILSFSRAMGQSSEGDCTVTQFRQQPATFSSEKGGGHFFASRFFVVVVPNAGEYKSLPVAAAAELS